MADELSNELSDLNLSVKVEKEDEMKRERDQRSKEMEAEYSKRVEEAKKVRERGYEALKSAEARRREGITAKCDGTASTHKDFRASQSEMQQVEVGNSAGRCTRSTAIPIRPPKLEYSPALSSVTSGSGSIPIILDVGISTCGIGPSHRNGSEHAMSLPSVDPEDWPSKNSVPARDEAVIEEGGHLVSTCPNIATDDTPDLRRTTIFPLVDERHGYTSSEDTQAVEGQESCEGVFEREDGDFNNLFGIGEWGKSWSFVLEVDSI
jgi:hypothetical protein